MLVASVREETWWSYQIGFPIPGAWLEVFNNDLYDGWVSPMVADNGGRIDVNGPPLHGFQNSSAIVIPANGFVVFVKRVSPRNPCRRTGTVPLSGYENERAK